MLVVYTNTNSTPVAPLGDYLLPGFPGQSRVCVAGAVAGAIGTGVGEYISTGSTSVSHVLVDAGVGCVAGAVAPIAATTWLGAVALGGAAKVLQTGLTSWINGECVTGNDLLASNWSRALGGVIGGPYGLQKLPA